MADPSLSPAALDVIEATEQHARKHPIAIDVKEKASA